jgi:trans-aconitate methyltransferase
MVSLIPDPSYYYSEQQQGIDRRLKDLVIQRCLPHLRGPSVLDLGYVDGSWTDPVLQRGWTSHIVEGAERHVDHARQRYAGRTDVRIEHVRFDEFRADRCYDSIIAGDMLRYLDDPTTFLRRLGDALTRDGRIVVTVPNSRSLHRRIGTLLGLQTHPAAANSQDKEVGNQRSYDRYELRKELLSAGLRILELRGCVLKPLSSGQMSDWNDDLLGALLQIGDELEDYAWFLYAICER